MGKPNAENLLPDQRIRYSVKTGGRGAWHVVRYMTFPASNHPGFWTRRSYERTALCGGLSAVVVGSDASGFPFADAAPTLDGNEDWLTCKRCIARWERLAARAGHGEENENG